MTDHLCNNRHRILAVLQSLGAEADSAEVAEVFQAVGEIEADLDSSLHAERLANAVIAQERDEATACNVEWCNKYTSAIFERDEARKALRDRDAGDEHA